MKIGWANMGRRERAFAIEHSLTCGIERVDAMNRVRYDTGADVLCFTVAAAHTPWVRVLGVADGDALARRLSMTRAQLEDWLSYDDVHGAAQRLELEQLLEIVEKDYTVGEAREIVANADALWDALDEC